MDVWDGYIYDSLEFGGQNSFDIYTISNLSFLYNR